MLKLSLKPNAKFARLQDESTGVVGALMERTVLVHGVTDDVKQQILDNGLTVTCCDGNVHLLLGKMAKFGNAVSARVIRAKHTDNRSVPDEIDKIILSYNTKEINLESQGCVKVTLDGVELYATVRCSRTQLQILLDRKVSYQSALGVAASLSQFNRMVSGAVPFEIWYIGSKGELLVDRRIVEESVSSDRLKLVIKDKMELCEGRLGVAQALQDSIRIVSSNLGGTVECELLLTQLAKSLDCFYKFCENTESVSLAGYKRLVLSAKHPNSQVIDTIIKQLMPDIGEYIRTAISSTVQPMRNSYIHSGVQIWMFAMQGGLSCEELNEIVLKIIKKIAYVSWGPYATRFTIAGGECS